jgi:hypothetical protein
MMKAFNEKLLLLLGVLEAKDGEALLPEGAPKNRELQFGVELVAGLSMRARDMVRASSRLFGEVSSDNVPATDATRWIINHAFTQRDARGVSLRQHTCARALQDDVHYLYSSLCARSDPMTAPLFRRVRIAS